MGEFLFWLHVFVIAAAIVSGFFLPLPLVLALIVLHKLHLRVFGDCILTRMKRYHGTLAADENFLQYAARRFFSVDLSVRGSDYVNYGIYAATACASLLRHLPFLW
ncbi:MAG: hypothetical protein HY435_02725 [Candidatus Liptonbacteria bacterium]|nr:hypothetical protein [Candidatus Liptonbacteria bacterium]